MQDFFKYLTPGEEDRQWGIFLNVAGKTRIPPNMPAYPNPDHPSDYYFYWDKGRVLNEFQINYITKGSGVYETETGKFSVKPGSLLLTRPGVWHRYRPLRGVGWTENYLGFDGSIPRNHLNLERFFFNRPVLQIGHREEFIDIYLKIFEMVLEEKPGFQQVASAMVMNILGYMVSLEKQKNFSGKRVEKIIRSACFELREKVEEKMDFQLYAENYHMGYSYFRKMFKQYTGFAPVQYHLNLKIQKAKELLIYTDQSVKEIASNLGFQSIHYFSRIFKKKTGHSPSEIRKKI
ncbi:MAG: AraC family transcriptional regulator [Bacteroidales bacterium]